MMISMHAIGAALLKNLPPSTYLDPRAHPTAPCPYRSPTPTPGGPCLEGGELWPTNNCSPQVLGTFLKSPTPLHIFIQATGNSPLMDFISSVMQTLLG